MTDCAALKARQVTHTHKNNVFQFAKDFCASLSCSNCILIGYRIAFFFFFLLNSSCEFQVSIAREQAPVIRLVKKKRKSEVNCIHLDLKDNHPYAWYTCLISSNHSMISRNIQV